MTMSKCQIKRISKEFSEERMQSRVIKKHIYLYMPLSIGIDWITLISVLGRYLRSDEYCLYYYDRKYWKAIIKYGRFSKAEQLSIVHISLVAILLRAASTCTIFNSIVSISIEASVPTAVIIRVPSSLRALTKRNDCFPQVI